MPRVHYCFSQHLNESLPPRKCYGSCSKNKRRCTCNKCKCREQVSPSRANQLVKSGAAEWVVLRKDPVEVKNICSMCSNDDILKKSCPTCNKTGEVTTTVLLPVYSSDIVMVTSGSGDPGHEVFRSVMSKQTPRVATIEYAHIQRAYVNEYPEDIERIEVYGKTNEEFIRSLIVPFIPDPWEGRTVFTFGPDDRTQAAFILARSGYPTTDLSEEDNYDE
jgi:hypothetical protein